MPRPSLTALWRPPGRCMPEYIRRDVEGGDFTEGYVPTNFPVAQLLHCMWELLSLNSAATIFLDGRNEDAAKLVALVSNHPACHNNVLVQFYPYTFRNGVEFVDMVGYLNPAAGWKRTVAVAPVLNQDTLPTLAGVRRNSLDYTVLYTAGQAWFTSITDTEMRIFGFGFPVSGISHGVNLTTGETRDLNEISSTNPGQPVAWPEGAESHGRELMAVPGNALRLGANTAIRDRVNDNLNAVLGTKNYTWPTDVAYPALNVNMGEAEQGSNI